MNLEKFLQQVIKDVEIELKDEFDRNFERKSFFDKAWPNNKLTNRRGSQMARTNNLRRSLSTSKTTDSVRFSSSLPYASLQNEGGEIIVTAKMKRYFWYMYYQTSGKVSKKKDGSASRSVGNKALSIEAQQWRNLALTKVGHRMKIPSKRFIGDHKVVRDAVAEIVAENMEIIEENITEELKKGIWTKFSDFWKVYRSK